MCVRPPRPTVVHPGPYAVPMFMTDLLLSDPCFQVPRPSLRSWAAGHRSRRPPLFLQDSGGLMGTPEESRGQQVEAEPVIPLRFGR